MAVTVKGRGVAHAGSAPVAWPPSNSRKSPARLLNGERLFTLDEAARMLRVSKAMLEPRVARGAERTRTAGATRYLAQTHVQRMATEIALLRSRGMLPLYKAARYLEVSEQSVLDYVEEGKLRECQRGAAFFSKEVLERFLVRQRGIMDPILLRRAAMLPRVARAHTIVADWIGAGWLKSVRLGGRVFVSRSAVETEARRRRRLWEGLRVLLEGGSLLERRDACSFLGISLSGLDGLIRRRALKPFRPEGMHRAFFRRRELEKVKALGLANPKRAPPNLMRSDEVARALAVDRTTVFRLAREKRLTIAARSGSKPKSTMGFDPKEVARLQAERRRLSELVTLPAACEILIIPPGTLLRLMREGLVVPCGRKRKSNLFDPLALRAMRNAPFMIDARRRAIIWRQSRRGEPSSTERR